MRKPTLCRLLLLSGVLFAVTYSSQAALDSVADGGEASQRIDPKKLVGVHRVTGRSPSGSEYKGTVEIRVVDRLVEMEWKTGGSVSRGQGVLAGTTLGVALDTGLAIYQLFGQSDGLSLIGVWAASSSAEPSSESILIGEADMTSVDLPAESFSGRYRSLRKTAAGTEKADVAISGGKSSTKVFWKTVDGFAKCQSLALGEGLAILSPGGLSVFSRQGAALEGFHLSGGKVITEELVRIE